MRAPPGRKRREPISWQVARERLARADAALASALELSPERQKAILDERARALARNVAAGERGETIELLQFSLGSERYGIETRFVQEVARLSDLTPVPGAPAVFAGIMNLRGEVLALVDLRKLFGIGVRGLTDLSRVIVLGEEHAEIGILADAVHGIDAVATASLLSTEQNHESSSRGGSSAPSLGGATRAYLRGITRDALIVLNGSGLLADERLVVDDKEAAPIA